MRKLLNTLYILDETAYLTLDGENIVCKSEQREPPVICKSAAVRTGLYMIIRNIHCFYASETVQRSASCGGAARKTQFVGSRPARGV